MRRMLIALVMWSTFVGCFFVALYIYKFGTFVDPSLSSEIEDWGQAGDYIGGTLGTYFAFVAFGGVIITVALQHAQLQEMRGQARRAEIQNLMVATSTKLDELLDSPAAILPPEMKEKFEAGDVPAFSVFRFIAALGELNLGATVKPEDWPQEMIDDTRFCVNAVAPLICIELQQLTKCLLLYEAENGNHKIAEIYKDRYQMLACWLHVVDALSSDIVNAYYEPAKLAESIRHSR